MCRIPPLVVLSLLLVTPVSAAERNPGLAALAQQIANALKEQGQNRVSISPFTPPPQYTSAGALGLMNDLIQELEQHKIQFEKRAPLGLQGVYALEEKQLRVRGQCWLTDKNNKKKSEFEFTLQNPEYISRLFGITVNIPPSQKPVERKELILAALQPDNAAKFKPLVEKSRVQPARDSAYAVEIWVLKSGVDPKKATTADYQQRECRLEDDLAFVDLKHGDIFAVRLINNSPHDAAAVLTLDGVNSLAFQESTKFKNYIIPASPGETPVLIQGWFRHNRTNGTNSFKIGDYADGAFQQLQLNPNSVGAITVTFAAAWEKGKMPSDEQPPLVATRGGEKTAVGEGEALTQQFQIVQREVGVMRTAITIRYQEEHK